MADAWGVPPKVTRKPSSRDPELPPGTDPKLYQLARTANVGKGMQPYQIDQAAGKMPTGEKPRVRMNADGSFTIQNITPATFFGPMQPMQPYQQDPAAGAVGRRFDYLTGYNTQYIPRSEEAVSFHSLRALADNLDVLRLIIETRKDQMEALDWGIQPRDKSKGDSLENDTKAIEDFFMFPDKEHGYSEWQRAILEDLFVIDAPCVYPRFTNGGDLWSLDLMNGALIKPLLDATGRRPMVPDPAYQQIIKGVPAVDYSAYDLIYRPRNVRTHKVYGYSPVEQIIVTVNIALRRQLFQLGYYTEGSIPDAFGMVPDTWTPAQIAEYQQIWDTMFENPHGGNSAERRKMKWIPGAKDIKFSKEAILKDEYDEWLARICCYAFSVEPTPFIKQQNRATAGTQKEQSRSEGLLPLKKWWKSFMDYIITFYIKRPDLEFSWKDEEAVDPLTQSQINVAYVNSGILIRNEVREDLGRDPLPEPVETAPTIPTTESPTGAPTAPTGEDSAKPVVSQGEKTQADATAKAARDYLHGLNKASGDDKAVEKIPAPEFVDNVDVPYVAGISTNGKKIYFDRRLPKSMEVGDTKFDPRDFVAVHELVEWMLIKQGMDYEEAHVHATRAEHAAVAARSIDPKAYEVAFQPIDEACYDAAKAGEMDEIPKDLAKYPYEYEGEMVLLEKPRKAEKLAKAGHGKPVNRDRQSIVIQRNRLARAAKRELKRQAGVVSEMLAHSMDKMAKAEPSDPDDAADEMVGGLDWDGVFDQWPSAVQDPIERSARDGFNSGISSLGGEAKLGASIDKDFVNEYALNFARARGAEMVGKKYDDEGNLVDNPNAEWVITDETREGVRSLVSNAIRDGWSNDRLATELKTAYVFSPDRAEKIARTETALADMDGHIAGWKESGVVEQKIWLTANDDLVSEECVANGDQGAIDLDDAFDSGDDSPPVHPNCRCTIAPIVGDTEKSR